MNTIKSNLKIVYTKNLDQFKLVPGNRDIDPKHVRELVEDWKVTKFFKPIIIDELFKVIDGQHRLEACKLLGIPISYIIVPRSPHLLDKIRHFNTSAKGWLLPDFLSSYIKKGNKDYKFLKEFVDMYKLSLSDSIALLAHGRKHSGGRDSKMFKKGEFYITPNHRKMAVHIAKKVNEIRFLSDTFKPFQKSAIFARALMKLVSTRGYKHRIMLEHLKELTTNLTKSVNKNEYLQKLEAIYNNHLDKKKQLHLLTS
jgi:hypothetical protein